MNFLLVLAAAIIEFNVVSPVGLRAHGWSRDWAGWLGRLCGGQAWWGGWRSAALLVGIPVLVTLAVFHLLFEHAPVVGHIASLLFLLLMLGPHDLNYEVEHYHRQLVEATVPAAAPPPFATLAYGVPLGPASGDEQFDETRAELASLALAADRAWYEPLFWFFVLGPCGALAYRLCATLGEPAGAAADAIDGTPADAATTRGVTAVLAQVREALEWVPGRVTVFALGIAGTLVPVLEEARAGGLGRWGGTPELIARGALAAVDHGRIHTLIVGDPHAYRVNQMLALVRRALNVWLVLFAVVALVLS